MQIKSKSRANQEQIKCKSGVFIYQIFVEIHGTRENSESSQFEENYNLEKMDLSDLNSSYIDIPPID